MRPVGQAAKTPPSHGGNGSSILPRVTTQQRPLILSTVFVFLLCEGRQRPRNEQFPTLHVPRYRAHCPRRPALSPCTARAPVRPRSPTFTVRTRPALTVLHRMTAPMPHSPASPRVPVAHPAALTHLPAVPISPAAHRRAPAARLARQHHPTRLSRIPRSQSCRPSPHPCRALAALTRPPLTVPRAHRPPHCPKPLVSPP